MKSFKQFSASLSDAVILQVSPLSQSPTADAHIKMYKDQTTEDYWAVVRK